MRYVKRRFESWVGQESKLLAAGYISTKAGGPKKAFFDKEAQAKLGNVQDVSRLRLQQYYCHCSQPMSTATEWECLPDVFAFMILEVVPRNW